MFIRVSNNEIINALDMLICCVGVKEDTPTDDLIFLLQKKNIQDCVQGIAARFDLPICIILSTDGFTSSSLAQTDQNGRGIEGISAQVSMPQDLPLFGTPALQGYPIKVRVSENCLAYPYTFLAVMEHELSHVLLASRRSPYKDSELHADLVPILLGFGDATGRRTIETTTSGSTTVTRTTTYGYLTDSQFELACSHVARILERHQRDKKHLIEIVKEVQRKLKKATGVHASFRDYFDYLNRRPPDRMRREHAQRLVQLHAHGYCNEWETRITAIKKSMEIAETFAQTLNHYTTDTIEHLKTHTQALELASDELDQITQAVIKPIDFYLKIFNLYFLMTFKNLQFEMEAFVCHQHSAEFLP